MPLKNNGGTALTMVASVAMALAAVSQAEPPTSNPQITGGFSLNGRAETRSMAPRNLESVIYLQRHLEAQLRQNPNDDSTRVRLRRAIRLKYSLARRELRTVAGMVDSEVAERVEALENIERIDARPARAGSNPHLAWLHKANIEAANRFCARHSGTSSSGTVRIESVLAEVNHGLPNLAWEQGHAYRVAVCEGLASDIGWWRRFAAELLRAVDTLEKWERWELSSLPLAVSLASTK
jgi:hypothetical protein